ncbi:type IV conjugative transfer system protein TraL [Novosphingopyxis sp.]|uniref:type IV conjugative transfer system protein TraL n=1 Tax=Novosphingopyxis sp. TaxID=2709690 RepID=UPI003B5CA812
MTGSYIIPRRLDDPELIGFWTIDEFIGLLVPFAWGILAQHVFIGIALSFVAWFALRKAKSGNAGSKLIHAAYWYLPGSFLGLKATPPSYCRLLVG